MVEYLGKLVDKVKDRDIRQLLSITQKNRKYPIDCLTDGAFEKLVKYIVALEDKLERKEVGARDTRP
jgi:hypothetical protein